MESSRRLQGSTENQGHRARYAGSKVQNSGSGQRAKRSPPHLDDVRLCKQEPAGVQVAVELELVALEDVKDGSLVSDGVQVDKEVALRRLAEDCSGKVNVSTAAAASTVLALITILGVIDGKQRVPLQRAPARVRVVRVELRPVEMPGPGRERGGGGGGLRHPTGTGHCRRPPT